MNIHNHILGVTSAVMIVALAVMLFAAVGRVDAVGASMAGAEGHLSAVNLY